MQPCGHKQQFVAPAFQGILGQYCAGCSKLMGAWYEATGNAVSPDGLTLFLELKRSEEDYNKQDVED